MISTSRRFIYIHIPKTAGNALQTALREHADDEIYAIPPQDGVHRFGLRSPFGTEKHAECSEYLAAMGPERFWSMLRCTTVRDPWARAISFYFSPHRGATVWDRDAFIALLPEVKPMAAYVRLPAGTIIPAGARPVDIVLHYETLAADFAALCGRLGIPSRPLPELNTGRHEYYRSYYDSELAALVGSRFAEDAELFGYGF